jgi:hypothetical protein
MVCIPQTHDDTERKDKEGKAEKPRAPSYFSQFFQCQLKQAEDSGDDSNSIRTLYIDRDPVTFKDISLHLQGYHVQPRDGSHFVKLFADAQFYSRMSSLHDMIYDSQLTASSPKVNITTLRRKHLHLHRATRFPNPSRALLRPRKLS